MDLPQTITLISHYSLTIFFILTTILSKAQVYTCQNFIFILVLLLLFAVQVSLSLGVKNKKLVKALGLQFLALLTPNTDEIETMNESEKV